MTQLLFPFLPALLAGFATLTLAVLIMEYADYEHPTPLGAFLRALLAGVLFLGAGWTIAPAVPYVNLVFVLSTILSACAFAFFIAYLLRRATDRTIEHLHTDA